MQESQSQPFIDELSRKHRLLVAEDDRDFRELLVTLLRAEGHEVVAVSNGTDLIDALAVPVGTSAGSKDFDLVITDVRMPGSSGLQALAQIGNAREHPPFIFLTAFGSADVHAEAKQLGALAILDKPFDFEDLRECINTCLRVPSV